MEIQPIKILHEAIKAVPPLRFALGVAGIVAAIAVIAAMGIDFRIAAFGTVVMLLLMTALVVFANLTKISKKHFVYPALFFMWAFLIITVCTACLLFSSVFFEWPVNLRHWLSPPPTQQQPRPPSTTIHKDIKVSRLAVARFDVNSNLDKWSWSGLSTSNFLTVQLQKVAKTVSVVDYQLLLEEYDSLRLDDLYGYLNIDHIISGNLEIIENRTSLYFRITQVSNQKIKFSKTITVNKADFRTIFDIQKQAALEIMRTIKGGFAIESDIEKTKLLPTTSLLSYEHYAKAVELTEQCRKYFANSDFDAGRRIRNQAIEEYEKALEIDPSFTWPLNNLAVIYSTMLDNDKAIPLLRRAVEIDPDYSEARLKLAYLLYQEHTFTKHRNEAESRSMLNEALKQVTQVLARKQNHTDALLLLGKIYLDLKQFEKAISAFQDAVKTSPNYSLPRTWLAISFIDVDRVDEAKEELRKAIENDVSNARAHFIMGELLSRDKNHFEAIKYFENSAKNGIDGYGIDPSYLTYTIGRAYLDIGDLRQGIMSYMPLFTMNPSLSGKAIQDLEEFAKNNPEQLKDLDKDTSRKLNYLINR